MAKTTKTEILRAALKVFARDGYEKTNIKDIADEVGLVKSGLYKHFESKEAIWNAAIDMMILYYESHMGAHRSGLKIPTNMDELYEMTMGMVNFTLHDKEVILVRRILTQEQFRDERVKKLASDYYVYNTEETFYRVFKAMMEKGTLKKCDARTLAFSYSAPISVLIRLCDREPEKEEAIIEKIEKFVRHFIEEYRI